MQTFSGFTVQGNRLVTKYVIDERVHCRFAECAAFARHALECRRAFDLFGEEVVDVYESRSDLLRNRRTGLSLTDTAFFATEESTRDASTLDMLTSIIRPIGI